MIRTAKLIGVGLFVASFTVAHASGTRVATATNEEGKELGPPLPDRIVPDPSPELNDAEWVNSLRPPTRVHRPAGPEQPGLQDPQPGTGDRGFYIRGAVGIDRVYALQDVYNDVRLPAAPTGSGLWLYAPTMAIPDRNEARLGCLEVVTIHFRQVTMDEAGHQFGVWDHCTGQPRQNFVYTRPLDAAFIDTYGGSYWTGIVHQVDGNGETWQALLFNRKTAEWEAVWTLNSVVTSDPARNGGWTSFETYGFTESNFCPPLPVNRIT